MDIKRKTGIIVVVLIMTLALCGCGFGDSANTIQPWESSDEQSAAVIQMLTAGDIYGFAGFDVDETFQSVKMGIEYYQDGKLKKDQEQGSFGLQEEEAKAVQGVVAFAVEDDGRTTMGVAAGGNNSSVSDIELPGFKSGEDESLASASIVEPGTIVEGEKCYIGTLNSGGDTVDTSVFIDPESRANMTGKSWFFYVVFSK